MGAGADRLVAIDYPAAHAASHLHLRYAVPELGRRAFGPHIMRLGQMGIGVDHLDGGAGRTLKNGVDIKLLPEEQLGRAQQTVANVVRSSDT